MNFSGMIVGVGAFLIIGVLHPVVIKAEYQWGKGCWPVFALTGLLCSGASLLVSEMTLSVLLGVLAFSLFWSIRELFEQEKRVAKGWYPSKAAKAKNHTQIIGE